MMVNIFGHWNARDVFYNGGVGVEKSPCFLTRDVFVLPDLNQTPQTTPPQLFLKVGEPLWIRCKAVHVNHGFGLSWELENKALGEVR